MGIFEFFNTAAAHGQRDGKLSYPGERDLCILEVSDHEDRSRSAGATASGEALDITPSQLSAPRRYKLAPFEIVQIAIAEKKISQLHENWENKRHHLESRLLKIDNELHQDVSEQQSLRQEFVRKGMRRPHQMVKPWVYFLLMFLLGVFEFPYNYQVFGFQFSDANKIAGFNIEAIFVSLGVSASLLILAHFTGAKLRQWSPKWRWTSYVIAVFSLLTVFAVLDSLYVLRGDFSKSQAVANQGFSVPSEDTPVGGQSEVTSPSNDAGRNIGFYMMLFNVGFFVVGTSLSYFSHDEDRDLEKLDTQMESALRRIDRLWKKRIPLAAEHDRALKVAEQKMAQVRQESLGLIAEYRDWNFRYRSKESFTEVYATEPLGLSLFRRMDLGKEIDILSDSTLGERVRKIRENEWRMASDNPSN